MRRMRIALGIALLQFAASALFAANVFSARMTTVPLRPYVGEDFEFVLEVTATPGCEIGIAELSGVPVGENLMAGQFSLRNVVASSLTNGEERAIHTFTAPARALKVFSFVPNSVARLKVTERLSQGFFTSWNTNMRAVRVQWNRFAVRELPTEGRPEDFSGAIGRYALSMVAEPLEVMPNDIVKLKLELSGRGYLGNAVPSMPKLDEKLFKSYPSSVTKNDDGTMTITQSVIPLSTNSVAIGSASLSFFDTASGVYTNYTTQPVMLTFIPERKSEAPAVREVVVDTGTKTKADVGVDVTKYLNLVRGGKSFPLEKDAVLRVAPGNGAKKILLLPAGTPVTPLDTSRGFLRVRAKDRTGWIAISLPSN